ncbi:MAG: homocysteine S-methyltransferase family protein [bacterium]
MTPIITNRIQVGPPLLFDGGLGSRLIQMGLPAGVAPEVWVLQHPQRIEQVHREYAEAGAEVITTCTFGANRLRLQKQGWQDQIAEINRQAVALVRQSIGEPTWIAGDLGPTGEFFAPLGTLTPAAASQIYREQAAFLAAAGIDFLLLETFYDLQEALICIHACQEVAPQLPVAATLTFDQKTRGFFTVMGNPLVTSLQELAEAGAFLVGANCTLEANGMLDLARVATAEIRTPLLVQANAGNPQITPEGVVYPQNPEEFCRCAAEMLDLGVRAIGGCCGTDERHIRALKELIQTRFPR